MIFLIQESTTWVGLALITGLHVVNPESILVQCLPIDRQKHSGFLWRNPCPLCVHPVVVSFKVSFPLATGDRYAHCWGMVASFQSHMDQKGNVGTHILFQNANETISYFCCIDFPEWLGTIPFKPDFLALCVLPRSFSIKMSFSAKVKENEFLVTSGL